jgi:hypothetical protein
MMNENLQELIGFQFTELREVTPREGSASRSWVLGTHIKLELDGKNDLWVDSNIWRDVHLCFPPLSDERIDEAFRIWVEKNLHIVFPF